MVVVLVFYSVFYWRHIWVLQKKYELFEIELSSIFKMILAEMSLFWHNMLTSFGRPLKGLKPNVQAFGGFCVSVESMRAMRVTARTFVGGKFVRLCKKRFQKDFPIFGEIWKCVMSRKLNRTPIACTNKKQAPVALKMFLNFVYVDAPWKKWFPLP